MVFQHYLQKIFFFLQFLISGALHLYELVPLLHNTSGLRKRWNNTYCLRTSHTSVQGWKVESWRAASLLYHVPMAWGRLGPGKEFSLLLILLLLLGWVLHWHLFCKIWEWKEDTARSMPWGASPCQAWLLYPMQHCSLSVQGGLEVLDVLLYH